MASTTLFKSSRGPLVPRADTFNRAGGKAYATSPKHALAQYAATGCLNATFYAKAVEDLDKVLALASQVEPEFVAKTAVYARTKGFMKDMPALLCAALSVLDTSLCAQVFHRVIDDGKMLKSFVQIVRSGAVGRKSLGSMPKRMVKTWLDSKDDAAVFKASVGQSPSLSDVIKMAHPKPASKSREALYGYLLGKKHDAAQLPELVQHYEAFKAKLRKDVPDVPFQMLTSLDLGRKEWTEIAKKASWQMTRMNLQTFQRHGVFEDKAMVKLVADRLSNRDFVRRSRVFPYQLLMAYRAATDVPSRIANALQEAMEHATSNVPEIEGKVFVLPDVSGSMSSPVTGHRKGGTTAVRCIDVAALVAAAVLRKNPDGEVIPFEQRVVKVHLNPYDSVMTNAQKLASIGGGGTSCSAPLAELNRRKAKGDLVIYVSDNESWVDWRGVGRGTATMAEWTAFKVRNPNAKLVCIDIQPNGHTQAPDRADVLNVGGFSDTVFDVIAAFAAGRSAGEHWVRTIEDIRL